jgi:hypothetical protein
MPVTIQSAYFGDEVSSRNVTDSINSRIRGGQTEIPVNSSIIPLLQVGGVITLTDDEKKTIQKQAEEECRGGADQNCVTNMKQTLTRQRLQAKETENVASTANIVKGRRLTVKVKDEKGATSEFVIPEGQDFKPDVAVRAAKGEPAKREAVAPVDLSKKPFQLPSLSGTLLKVATIGSAMIGTFLYVFSIMLTYRAFLDASYTKAIVLAFTALAAFVPGSGYVIVFLYNFVPEYFPKVEQ